MIEAPGKASSVPQSEKQATRPFSIRLTNDEKQVLLTRAGSLPLGTYIRDLILADDVQAVRVRWHNPVKDHQALGRVLAGLGQSRIANNLNQLAKAMNIGAMPVTPEIEQEISEAVIAVFDMRRASMNALGISNGVKP